MLQVQAGAVALAPEAGWQCQRDVPEEREHMAIVTQSTRCCSCSSLQHNDSSQVKQQTPILILLLTLSTGSVSPLHPGALGSNNKDAAVATHPEQGTHPQVSRHSSSTPSAPRSSQHTAAPSIQIYFSNADPLV